MRSTHTYVTMQVSARAYAEIRKNMIAAGYTHAVHADGRDVELIDMHGLALQSTPPPPPGGELIVGLTAAGDEVVINHPDLLCDADGTGHIVFSPAEARNLAAVLIKKANDAEAR